jgi:diguanylate cyclase (GGDEF)-like protein
LKIGASTDALHQAKIFSMLEDEELSSVAEILQEEVVPSGRKLFDQGDEGNELYIVKSGCIGSSITLEDGSQREIASFREGEFFGEMSIFESAPRSATCYAKTDCVVLKLPATAFFTFVKQNSEAAIKIMYRMLNITTQRLENTGQFLSDMVTWGEDARRRAITDEFTGVYNRRFLEDVIEDHFRTCQRDGSHLSLIMVDLDRFREINEAYGNEMGDRVILEAVDVFRRRLRETDIIARYGGDEFTVLMPNTSLEEAARIAWAICREVSELNLLKDAGGGAIDQITTSQGVAAFPDNTASLKELRAAADEALYRAKEAGKNRVESAVPNGGGNNDR